MRSSMRFFLPLLLLPLPLVAQTPYHRAARCPECFPGGPVYTNYPTRVAPPAVYPGYGYGGYGYRVGGIGAAAASVAIGAGIAIAVDEIQTRRAEAADRRRNSGDTIQVRNCRTYAAENKNDPPIMVCEDRDGRRIVLEREK